MIIKLIKKFNLDIQSMKQEGTIAFLTFLICWRFFGIENAILAYPIALTSSILRKENFNINPIENTIYLIILDLSLVIISFIATQNIFLGFFINMFTIFFIAYKFSIGYNPLFYKPFLMLYIFTSFYTVDFSLLPKRLLSILFGFSLIIIFHLFLNKISYRALVNESISNSLKELIMQTENILNGSYSVDLQKSICKELDSICYNIYTTRSRKSLTNNIGSIQFKIYIILENLNLEFKNLNSIYSSQTKKSKIITSFLKELIPTFNELICYISDEENFLKLEKRLKKINNFHEKIPNHFVFMHDISVSLNNLYLYLADINTLEEKLKYKPYYSLKNTDKTQFKFRENLHLGSIKFNFSLRISLTLSIVLLLGSLLDLTKISWLGITIMSIMQPYYEDTLKKSKDRFKGNIFAVLIITILLNVFQNKFIYFLTLTLTLYLTYSFKSYCKLSLFTAISAICMASLTYEVNTVSIYRISYLLLGILITYLANKLIFPYSLDKGIKELSFKLIKTLNLLFLELIKINEKNEDLILNLLIHINLISNKLSLRNIQKQYENINLLLESVQFLSINLSYYTLLKKDLGLVCGVNKDNLIQLQKNLQNLIDSNSSLYEIIIFLNSTLDSLINCPYSEKTKYNFYSNGLII